MLFGNLFGHNQALKRLVNDLWRQLTKGQRASSEAKAVVRSERMRPWLFTLAGNQEEGPVGTDPVSRAYQSARESRLPAADAVAPKLNVYLPSAHDDSKNDVCNACPIKPRCAVWHSPEK
jgi:hypothetical protein